jgi:single-strand DNA-binding protein
MNPKTTIIGRVGQDPEAIGSGIRFRVATNDRVKNEQTGQWEDKDTSWWTVKAWKRLAEQSKDVLKKGQEVVIYGSMKEENWTDSSGSKRVSYEIIADTIALTTHTLNKNYQSSPLAASSTTEKVWG